jgi:hypothetical protein
MARIPCISIINSFCVRAGYCALSQSRALACVSFAIDVEKQVMKIFMPWLMSPPANARTALAPLAAEQMTLDLVIDQCAEESRIKIALLETSRGKLEDLKIYKARGHWYVYPRGGGDPLIKGCDGSREDALKKLAEPDLQPATAPETAGCQLPNRDAGRLHSLVQQRRHRPSAQGAEGQSQQGRGLLSVMANARGCDARGLPRSIRVSAARVRCGLGAHHAARSV